MGVRCDGSVAGGNARSTFPYLYLPLGARELCTSVIFSWFLSVASHEVGKRELAVPVTLGGHWPPGCESFS